MSKRKRGRPRKRGKKKERESHLEWEDFSHLSIPSGIYSACRLPWRFTADTPDGKIEGMPGDWWVANKHTVRFFSDDVFRDKFTSHGSPFLAFYRLKTKDKAELDEEMWDSKQKLIRDS